MLEKSTYLITAVEGKPFTIPVHCSHLMSALELLWHEESFAIGSKKIVFLGIKGLKVLAILCYHLMGKMISDRLKYTINRVLVLKKAS